MRIGIFETAGETDVGELSQAWDLWVAGERRALRNTAAREWRSWTSNCVQAVIERYTRDERARTGLVLATTKADLDREVQSIRSGFSGVPSLGEEALRLASQHHLGSAAWAVSTACSSGLVAIIEAAVAVNNGDADRMVTIAADDVHAAEGFIRHGFAALKAISTKGCSPFDVGRDGLLLGSAVAACVIAPVDTQRRPAAEIQGFGVSNDAVHMTAPDRDAGGLIRAMQQALAMANLPPADIDVVFAHGTGTLYNDAMEAVAIDRVFSQQHARPAITGIKGLIGHTLGASGLFEALLATFILRDQRVPPIIGLKTPERNDLDLVTRARTIAVRHIMKVASGFGGMNAAVILGRATA